MLGHTWLVVDVVDERFEDVRRKIAVFFLFFSRIVILSFLNKNLSYFSLKTLLFLNDLLFGLRNSLETKERLFFIRRFFSSEVFVEGNLRTSKILAKLRGLVGNLYGWALLGVKHEGEEV